MATAASGGSRRKFGAIDVKRVYFGNWLRDYSQAVDVGSLKYVEAGTIRIIVSLPTNPLFDGGARDKG
jgi:hypothetical protein